MDSKISKLIASNIEQLTCCEKISPLGNGKDLPSLQLLCEIVELTRAIIFPGYFGGSLPGISNIKYVMGANLEKLYLLLCDQIQKGLQFDSEKESSREKAEEIAREFIDQIKEIKRVLMTDIEAVYNNDPAAKSYGEVILCYPGVTAITYHRIAHALLKLGVPVIPRIISEAAHSKTGIDIHPAATIGDYFSIDHGTGIVVGQTCIIGSHVHIYQGVTLGAKNFTLDESGHPLDLPRHPIIEDNVTIYSNSSILGRITIGKGSIIGGNLWITSDIEPNSKITQRK